MCEKLLRVIAGPIVGNAVCLTPDVCDMIGLEAEESSDEQYGGLGF